MLFTPFLLLSSAAWLAPATALQRCGAKEPNGLEVDSMDTASARVVSAGAHTRSIDTYVHVVTSPHKRHLYSDPVIQEQVHGTSPLLFHASTPD